MFLLFSSASSDILCVHRVRVIHTFFASTNLAFACSHFPRFILILHQFLSVSHHLTVSQNIQHHKSDPFFSAVNKSEAKASSEYKKKSCQERWSSGDGEERREKKFHNNNNSLHQQQRIQWKKSDIRGKREKAKSALVDMMRWIILFWCFSLFLIFCEWVWDVRSSFCHPQFIHITSHHFSLPHSICCCCILFCVCFFFIVAFCLSLCLSW